MWAELLIYQSGTSTYIRELRDLYKRGEHEGRVVGVPQRQNQFRLK